MATKKISEFTAKAANLETTDLILISDYNGSTYDSKYVTGAEVMREVIQLSGSDLTTALSVGTTVAYLRMPFAMTVTEVRASLLTAGSTSGTTTIDINKNGTSILSTKLTIDATEKTSTTAATAAVISTSSLSDDDEITIDIDAISGGATEAGLIVTLIGNRA